MPELAPATCTKGPGDHDRPDEAGVLFIERPEARRRTEKARGARAGWAGDGGPGPAGFSHFASGEFRQAGRARVPRPPPARPVTMGTIAAMVQGAGFEGPRGGPLFL